MTRPHLITTHEPDPAPGASGPWLALSAALTEQIADLAEREDVTVLCAPGAGRGAPGCFIPALATVELDGVHLGRNPATCDPARPSDRDHYPALWGVFVHEAAHARHSVWETPDTTPAAYAEAATLLEESRIEAAHLRRRPADRCWLRASASQLILADFTPTTASTPPTAATPPAATPPATDPQAAATPRAAMTPWDAARAAALLLARVDAGILDSDETSALAATVTGILGASRLSALGALWHVAHHTADDDQETMLDLGRRWCTIVGVDPDQPAPQPDEDSTGDSDKSEGPSPLVEAITTTLAAVAAADVPPRLTGPDKAKQRQDEQDTRRRAASAARRVFNPQAAKITGTRRPTTAEQAAARRLARHLRAAAYRDRVTITTTAATPPGRLRMRGALAADAQRAAGTVPTAEPFTRTTRRHVPTPPLHIGIACDVSHSMNSLAAPVASAAGYWHAPPPTSLTPAPQPSSLAKPSDRSPIPATHRHGLRYSRPPTTRTSSSRPSTLWTPPWS